MAPVISVEHLTKRYGDVQAVRDVSFSVDEGEVFGILGPNGAGKTTSVECLQGPRQPDGGTLRVLGLDPQAQTDELRQLIGSQLQASALPGRMKVGEALRLFAAFAANPVDVDALLARWWLEEQRERAFADLSGGQKQRLFIALAFVNNPRLVFLDGHDIVVEALVQQRRDESGADAFDAVGARDTLAEDRRAGRLQDDDARIDPGAAECFGGAHYHPGRAGGGAEEVDRARDLGHQLVADRVVAVE